MQNGLWAKMGKDAMDKLAKGQWETVSPNVLIMACFHLLTNHLVHKILRPMWAIVWVIAGSALWWVVKGAIEMIGGG